MIFEKPVKHNREPTTCVNHLITIEDLQSTYVVNLKCVGRSQAQILQRFFDTFLLNNL